MAVLKCHKKNEHKRLSEPRQVQNTRHKLQTKHAQKT